MLVALLDEVADVLELPESDPVLESFTRFFFAPVLKSVSYQPVPFNLKAAAEISFDKLSLPQAGQVTSGLSEIFCSASMWCSQDWHWHWYS